MRQATITLSAVDEKQLAYIAGIFDGEGCVLVRKRAWGNDVRLIVTNTHLGLLNWLRDKLGVGRITPSCGTAETRKPCYHWELTTSSNCFLLAKALIPYTIVKRDKLLQLVSFMHQEYMFDVDGGGHITNTGGVLETRIGVPYYDQGAIR
ncbi:hypothetical protein LCGC14_0892740 [marine sediment metagenome]|uniref:Homing endonuclease LAGLIDADG domain-containing protein n=1 Tax=marine sediment metagenome TaxID=412755 RepID=A0A0F9S5Q5_9ZZZZ